MTALRSRLPAVGAHIRIAGLAGLASLAALTGLAGCSSQPESVAPANLSVDCRGEGSPTVILMPGMNTDSQVFSSLSARVAEDTRVCSYSRAGLGKSPPWPEDLPDPSAGMAADQLRATLEEEDVPGPYVLLGWSYGGLVAQAFAERHPDLVSGLVLEDAATPELFDDPDWTSISWAEGGRSIDTETTTDEVSGLDLGSLPLVVLTQGTMENWPDPPLWTKTQDRLATLSDDVIHVIATDAGHAVHWDAEALVAKAVSDVVEAVRSGDPLPECDDDDWRALGGECRAP